VGAAAAAAAKADSAAPAPAPSDLVYELLWGASTSAPAASTAHSPSSADQRPCRFISAAVGSPGGGSSSGSTMATVSRAAASSLDTLVAAKGCCADSPSTSVSTPALLLLSTSGAQHPYPLANGAGGGGGGGGGGGASSLWGVARAYTQETPRNPVIVAMDRERLDASLYIDDNMSTTNHLANERTLCTAVAVGSVTPHHATTFGALSRATLGGGALHVASLLPVRDSSVKKGDPSAARSAPAAALTIRSSLRGLLLDGDGSKDDASPAAATLLRGAVRGGGGVVVVSEADSAQPFRRSGLGSAIITGGMGALGDSVARWMMRAGAVSEGGGVVLTGRTGRATTSVPGSAPGSVPGSCVTPAVTPAVFAVTSPFFDVVVTATRADASCSSEAAYSASLLHRHPGFNDPVTSVFNVGGVLADALAHNQSPGWGCTS
jgi:hypothetical protein